MTTNDERLAKVYDLERKRRHERPPDWLGDFLERKERAANATNWNLTLERDELRLLVEMAADALEGLGDETTAPILRACLAEMEDV